MHRAFPSLSAGAHTQRRVRPGRASQVSSVKPTMRVWRSNHTSPTSPALEGSGTFMPGKAAAGQSHLSGLGMFCSLLCLLIFALFLCQYQTQISGMLSKEMYSVSTFAAICQDGTLLMKWIKCFLLRNKNPEMPVPPSPWRLEDRLPLPEMGRRAGGAGVVGGTGVVEGGGHALS